MNTVSIKSNAKKFVSLAGIVVTLLKLAQSAQAASFSKQGVKNNQESEFAYQELKQYAQLPDLPQYTGQALFVTGVVYPAAVLFDICVSPSHLASRLELLCTAGW